jgi:YjbE family integral membrane protein
VPHAAFFIGALQVLLIDLVLSGDNAVVIAMACRALPARQRMWGLVIGVTLAVALRIVFAGVLTQLLQLPYLKLVGGLALLYIAARLMAPDFAERNEIRAAGNLWGAIAVVIIADVVMSIDNILPIAAVARGNLALLAIGLAASIPLIIVGAALIARLLERFPIFIWAGAALLGWLAGDLIAGDPVVSRFTSATFGETVAHRLDIGAALAGLVFVLAFGAIVRRRAH